MSQETTERAAPVVIAIDGPAASGKGTIARRIAARLGYAHLDTGLLYRAVASLAHEKGVDPAIEAAAAAIATQLEEADLHRPDLRDPEIGLAASVAAAHPAVRAALLERQRFFADNPRGGALGVVMDGRDIGTVVRPDADVKLFVEARPEVRARRRAAELTERGLTVDLAELERDIRERDRRDRERAEAPLAQAADAVLLDTSDLSIEQAVASAADIISRRLGGRAPG